MIISLIAAMSENRVIGVQGRLPWHLPADIANFRMVTQGKKFVMGRKSYEAEDKLCSDAGNVIITRQEKYKVAKGDKTAHSLQHALELLHDEKEIFVLGGAEIFNQAIERADFLYITLVRNKFIGDTFFPEIDTAKWTILEEEDFEADAENRLPYSFVKYGRKGSRLNT